MYAQQFKFFGQRPSTSLAKTTSASARLIGLLALLAGSFSISAQVRINELMHHPNSTNLLEEWVELYNPGPTNADLTGWKFSNGLQFSFPTNTILATGNYLVVPADVATFAANHPAVTAVLPVSSGPLSGHTLQLDDSKGQAVSTVKFYEEGDWASRMLSYNGYGHMGWEWYAPHAGLGSSLELINPALPLEYAQNWGSSSTFQGTPGQPNSIAQTNVAPFIVGAQHSPIIPQPADVVTVSARIVDEHTNGVTAKVFYRNASTATPPAFSNLPMFDDGMHGDGLAQDGIFAAVLPAQPDGTVIEFYLQASDLEGHTRVYPDVVQPASPRTANLLYQVDSGVYAGTQPIYRIIMTEMERAELRAIGRQCPDSDSDAHMNATWITADGVVAGGTTTQIRYNVGVRNRGHGTRQSDPNNYHVSIPEDRTWKKQTGINLNSQYAPSQVLGSTIFRQSGVSMPDSRLVQVRVNSVNLMANGAGNSFGSYTANENFNGDFIQRTFPLDPGGNAYRGIRDQILCISASNSVADLTWHGTDPTIAVYANAYFKETNLRVNDFSDVIDLIAVFNSVNGHAGANYVADVQARIDVDEWMKYMALNTLLDNTETCLANGVGDDYALFRGVKDTRFQVLPYDMDSMMGLGLTATPPGNSIWQMNALAAMDRFMKTPEFAPIYFRWLKEFADTTFSEAEMNPLLDRLLKNSIPAANLANFKAYNVAQVQFVLGQIPLTLTVSNNLPIASGFPRSTSPTVALHGTANAIDTRAVVVSGVTSTWSAWQGTWTLNAVPLTPGINRILVQAFGNNGVETERASVDIWYDDGSVQTAGGTIASDTTWAAAGGPYNITSSLTITSGATLTIEPGTSVFLGSGVDLTIASGGRLLAVGTATAPIRFTVVPGSGVSWGGLTLNGGAGSPETRIAYADFEANSSTCIHSAGGTILLDHVNFLTTTHQYLSLDSSSFLVSGCYFPTTTAAFELGHGSGGIKAGGRGIVRDCYFGTTTGYNDIIDFTGGNREFGQPIIQFLNNVFNGGSDDILDLDGTDAWIEGNIFLHCHKNGSPDTSSAISGGSNGSDTSEVTIIGNLFYDCDHAALAKEGNFFTFLNNTIVRQTHEGGSDTEGAVVCLADVGTTEGAGYYLEGNIIHDVEKLVQNQTTAIVTFTNNLLPVTWTGPGGGNSTNHPLLAHIPALSETTNFTTWQQAQVFRQWFSLQPGSPALGTGPNGRDKGGVIPLGASVSGEPAVTNNQTSATLTVGTARTGSGIPTAGFPQGSGYTHYLWRLDGGAWSVETPVNTPIQLSGLVPGPHTVEVNGKRDSGSYQNDSDFGADASLTTSRTWVVDPNYLPPTAPTVRLNEVLAKNSATFTNLGNTPDLIELYNYGPASVDLSGLGLTDSIGTPYKYTFPVGTSLASHAFLVLICDNLTGGPYVHTGFSLKQNGDDVALFDKPGSGGVLLDWVVFGQQLADFSVGRRADNTWGLCQPTFGVANRAQATGSIWTLKINEWLADAQFVANNDFIELYNPDLLPVALDGLFLSDAAGAPARNEIAPLSFIPGNGLDSFIADGNTNQGPDHLDFKLSADVGIITLSAPDLKLIDAVSYGPQRTDVSQGRSPNGSDVLVSFPVPTPGGANPGTLRDNSYTVTNLTIPLMPLTQAWRYNQSANLDGVAWTATNYSDIAWQGPSAGLLAFENNSLITPLIHTTLQDPRLKSPAESAYYFRTTFVLNTNLDGYTFIANARIDDGAAIYVNGVEIPSRIRINPGAITFTTFANSSPPIGGDAEANDTFSIPNSYFVQGVNYVAVEVHQVNSTSTDIVWGMSLDAIRSITNYSEPNLMPVVLNEVLASNRSLTNSDGAALDWIELYNPGTNTVDLTGTSLSDNPSVPGKFVFPANSFIPAGGFRIVFCDGATPVSTNNTGFDLNAQGSAIYFFDAPARGGSLLDALNFGLQIPDHPLGRLPNGTGLWVLNLPTPGGPNLAAGLASVSTLKVNEWMADPPSGSDWFEIYNPAPLPVAIGGLFLTDDLNNHSQSPIPPLSFIGSDADGFRQFFADGGEGSDHVAFSLKKSGEAVGIFSPNATLLDGISFGAQVTGVSEGRFPDGGTAVASFPASPSPAESNYLPLPNVLINEILTHTDPPLEDAVELFNPSSTSVNIGGWYLSNSKDDFKKYRIPGGTELGAGGFGVIYENQFNASNAVPFTFNSAHGDAVIISQADVGGNLTGYRAELTFGAAQNGVSFGRYRTSVGEDFTALSARTFGRDNPSSIAEFRTGTGLANAYPKVGPLVISEFLYYSTTNGVENSDDEFVEVQNITASPVPLFDPAFPTNTWRLRDAVSYVFPTNLTLAAEARLLVVSFDPADATRANLFRTRFSVPANVPLFGPWSGRLANDNDSIELVKPDPVQLAPHPDAGFVPQILVDKVRYSALAPWPTAASNGSNSLQRIIAEAYANDPVNWVAATPTAGRTNITTVMDSDGDGLPDSWEMAYFGTLARDGTGDFDGDGLTDLQEFMAGTSPGDPNSYLKIDSLNRTGNVAVVRFAAVAGKTYSILYRDAPNTGSWLKLIDVPAQPVTGDVSVSDNAVTGQSRRFYRLVTPALP